MDLLQIALIDANEKANKQYAGQASSVVSGWLTWEVNQAGLAFCKPSQADIVFLVYAGALDWLAECRAYIKRSGVSRCKTQTRKTVHHSWRALRRDTIHGAFCCGCNGRGRSL